MNQRPVSVDSSGQKRRVFVVRRHDYAVALEASKVFGQGQRHSGATARIGSVGDHVLLQFGHESDARILNAPDFLGKLLRAGHQCRFAIDLPPIDAVSGARGAKMGQAAPIFDAAKQQGRSIRQQRRARIEHAINGIWPILTGQNRVGRMPKKQWLEASVRKAHKILRGHGHDGISVVFGLLQRAHFEQCHQER